MLQYSFSRPKQSSSVLLATCWLKWRVLAPKLATTLAHLRHLVNLSVEVLVKWPFNSPAHHEEACQKVCLWLAGRWCGWSHWLLAGLPGWRCTVCWGCPSGWTSTSTRQTKAVCLCVFKWHGYWDFLQLSDFLDIDIRIQVKATLPDELNTFNVCFDLGNRVSCQVCPTFEGLSRATVPTEYRAASFLRL